MPATKAFVCDFDGTLYHHGTQRSTTDVINDKDRAAIDAFQLAGGRFGVCTGRAPRALTLHAGTLLTPDFVIAVNGALVLGARGKLIAERRMPYDVVAGLSATYGSCTNGLVIAAGRDLYTLGHRHHHLIRSVASLAELPAALHGVSIATASERDAARIAGEVNLTYGDVVTAVRNAAGVDVMPAGCSRATGVALAKRALGINTMAGMGDALNDVGLLGAVDVAYGFTDAPIGLAAHADALVGSVARALADFTSR